MRLKFMLLKAIEITDVHDTKELRNWGTEKPFYHILTADGEEYKFPKDQFAFLEMSG